MNTVISNHRLAANIIAFGLVASVSIISAAAIDYSGNLAKASYEGNVLSDSAKPEATAPSSKALVLTATSGTLLPLQEQKLDIVGQLQPARNAVQLTQSASDLQPSTNSIQLTADGASLQGAAGVL